MKMVEFKVKNTNVVLAFWPEQIYIVMHSKIETAVYLSSDIHSRSHWIVEDDFKTAVMKTEKARAQNGYRCNLVDCTRG